MSEINNKNPNISGWLFLVVLVLIIAGVVWVLTRDRSDNFQQSDTETTKSFPSVTSTLTITSTDMATPSPSIATSPNDRSTDIPTPTPSFTLIPTSTSTDSLSPTPTLELILVIHEEFNQWPLNPDNWNGISCDEDNVDIQNGKIVFNMPKNEGPNETEHCTITPNISSNMVRKISLKVSILDGIENKGWVGLFGSCGSSYLNFKISQVGVFIDDFQPDRIEVVPLIIDFESEPKEWLLVAEWNGSEWFFSVVDNDKQESRTYSYDCDKPPETIAIGAATNKNGHVEGTIDDVKIWISP